MKKFIALSIISIIIFITFSMQNSFAGEIKSTLNASSTNGNSFIFNAGDASPATKWCLAQHKMIYRRPSFMLKS